MLAYGKTEPHLGLVFESNIFLSHDKPILRGVRPDRWTPRQAAFHRNLYWCETGPVTFSRGGAAVYASQPFPKGFKAEAGQYAPLGDVPAVTKMPGKSDWKRAMTLTRFVVQSGDTEAPAGAGELRFLRQGDTLHIRGVFKRPSLHEPVGGALWAREHVELFLKPFADRPGMVQLGLASDGETAVVWHDCEAPGGFAVQGEATVTADGWQATLRLSLAAIAAAATGDGDGVPTWSFIAGFARLPEVGDWGAWQAQGHDPEGVVADPLFLDPKSHDFRLRPDSPALALGFVPFDLSTAGVRKP